MSALIGSLECPEVNGFIASMEERSCSEDLSEEVVAESVAGFMREHADCFTCSDILNPSAQ